MSLVVAPALVTCGVRLELVLEASVHFHVETLLSSLLLHLVSERETPSMHHDSEKTDTAHRRVRSHGETEVGEVYLGPPCRKSNWIADIIQGSQCNEMYPPATGEIHDLK